MTVIKFFIFYFSKAIPFLTAVLLCCERWCDPALTVLCAMVVVDCVAAMAWSVWKCLTYEEDE